jgi:hypothetical protein
VEQLGGRSSILVKQRADHARLDRLMDRARFTLTAGGREHMVALRAVARLVFTHAFAEESVLFPAARKVLAEGESLTLHIETAHQQVDELVTRLDAWSADADGHAALRERTFAVLDEDVRSEEEELLPQLQQLLSPRQLRALGRRWELLRRISPTRPHPLVSRRPPGQALSALPLTVLDRGRDRLPWLDEATSRRSTVHSRRPRPRLSGSRCCSAGSPPRPAGRVGEPSAPGHANGPQSGTGGTGQEVAEDLGAIRPPGAAGGSRAGRDDLLDATRPASRAELRFDFTVAFSDRPSEWLKSLTTAIPAHQDPPRKLGRCKSRGWQYPSTAPVRQKMTLLPPSSSFFLSAAPRKQVLPILISWKPRFFTEGSSRYQPSSRIASARCQR